MCPSDPGTFAPQCCACKYTVKLSLYHFDRGEDGGGGERAEQGVGFLAPRSNRTSDMAKKENVCTR